MIRRLATVGVTAALLLTPLTAPAAQAASACPSGARAASDVLTVTQTVDGLTVRLHWKGRWCVNAAGTAVTRPTMQFSGSYKGTVQGMALRGRVIRTKSSNVRKQQGIVVNVSRLAAKLPASVGGSTVRIPGAVKIGLSPKGWFVNEQGVRLPDRVKAS